jgi:hypothetical protein
MNQNTYQLTLTFEQILSLVEQLPDIEKIQRFVMDYTVFPKITEEPKSRTFYYLFSHL